MYYKIIDKLPDEMQVYKETPLDMEHPAYGVKKNKNGAYGNGGGYVYDDEHRACCR